MHFSKKLKLLHATDIYHFVFFVSLAHMILHPELFTYKALVSGLEITELILLLVNLNLSLYVLCNCYFNNFFKLLFYMYLQAQKKMRKYLSYISPKTMLIPTRTCYFAKSTSFFAKEDNLSISGYSKKTDRHRT